jgi:beta-1,4-N-acetylglucosaminyltransferase
MMVNFFVTVGTTPFDGLIINLDEFSKKNKSFNFIFQKSQGKYTPTFGESFNFSNEIEKYYIDADIVITHAGAGSIYRLLELNKKVIIVPNFERIDKHQSDIALFMEKNQHALVLWDYENLENTILESLHFSPRLYEKDSFFKSIDISSYIDEVLK